MKPIKIYGESKTGTTYLQKLLELNTDAEILEGNAGSPLGWKHGFPQAGEALYIFIFRDVYEWAKSLIADPIDKRFNGLESEFGGTKYDFWNVWQNPIQCRIAKYYSYIGFAEVNDTLLVSYEYLSENPYSIMGYMWERSYPGLPRAKEFQDIPNHTYKDVEGRDNPDRNPLTEQHKTFIDSHVDPKLESFVNNLTIQ